jgi:mannitol operon transcriptional antiterminator
MALFHCIDEAVKRPYFGIFDLSSTFEIENMEKESMELKRVLLMMAPEPLDESIQEIMGTISSAIVESTFNLQMFDTGRKDLLQHYLSGLFLGKVK